MFSIPNVGVLLFAAMAASANGFSLLPSQQLQPLGGVAPLAAPLASKPTRRRASCTLVTHSPSSLTTLHMSEVSTSSVAADDLAIGDQAAESELLSASVEEMVLSQQPQDTLERITQKLQQIDINEVINTTLIVLVSIAVCYKLTMVNAGMTRGWSPEEIGARMAADNWGGYLNVLRDSPVSTKAVTSATVYTIGDVIAQRTEGESIGSLDRPRILRSLLAGLIGHGPLSHCWYNISEDLFNFLHLTQWWSFLPKVAIDQATWGPFWNNTYIVMLGLMKRESLESIWEDIKRTTIPLVVSGLKLWPLAHCITYGVIPVENRLILLKLFGSQFWRLKLQEEEVPTRRIPRLPVVPNQPLPRRTSKPVHHKNVQYPTTKNATVRVRYVAECLINFHVSYPVAQSSYDTTINQAATCSSRHGLYCFTLYHPFVYTIQSI
ncbi:PXMP2/4 family protein [Seminavis robusta]|uniref:PXMP2/4 family protein n=1 Tax=Seminavis robusta TaxID=568900 RepID=A0A9N8EPF6_9STRA|nr:PXMP2/4 family protein [Seminavis robusta]|eukprot:Sro1370_g267050.1 PXMP2/4 family protein (436) ;mRNA; f:23209-24606